MAGRGLAGWHVPVEVDGGAPGVVTQGCFVLKVI